ncbi:metallophosphoesterase [Sphingomonas gilva]|uniref:Metallophosphoesterase n=1 Tax=Sphingomonas gilva TaxID=2305907 RepID=A0A396RQ29_9SPHN|nr:metallophosphoesterase [Sphingomonas gilva]RHW18499.1 metallophosphoesterase [Sphingomonas gilva]
MIRLFHVSDIHFGAEDAGALAWFEACVAKERPDAVVMTGDLTMRARSHEFEEAGEWLASLGVPVTVEVGNHDLPYFNPFARIAQPYRRYRKVERLVERPLDIKGVAIVPLRTTARFQWRLNWSKGHVSGKQLAKTLAIIDGIDKETAILVACHHPLIDQGTHSSGDTTGGAEALAALARAGADAVLTGHVHDPFDVEHEVDGAPIRLIGAGTLSERTRASPPAFNELRIAQGEIETILRTMSPLPEIELPVEEGVEIETAG